MMKKYLLYLAFPALLLSSCAPRIVTHEPTAKVVVVKKTPRNYKVVKLNDKRYYLWNGKYHRKTRRGYVVVKM
jgi:hypothetical protein